MNGGAGTGAIGSCTLFSVIVNTQQTARAIENRSMTLAPNYKRAAFIDSLSE